MLLQQSYRKAVTTARRDKNQKGRAAGLTEEQKQEIRCVWVCRLSHAHSCTLHFEQRVVRPPRLQGNAPALDRRANEFACAYGCVGKCREFAHKLMLNHEIETYRL